MNKKQIISEYMASLGRKGGAAGKGSPHKCDPEEAHARAQKAARTRWDKYRREKELAVRSATDDAKAVAVAVNALTPYMAGTQEQGNDGVNK